MKKLIIILLFAPLTMIGQKVGEIWYYEIDKTEKNYKLIIGKNRNAIFYKDFVSSKTEPKKPYLLFSWIDSAQVQVFRFAYKRFKN